MAAVVEDDTRNKLTESPCIGLLIDESTDISTDKKLSIFARVVNPAIGEGVRLTLFVGDVDIESGRSEHVFQTVSNVLANDFDVSTNKIFAFGG